ncbi:hypothetical protein ABZS93_16155 [Streptomyces sp900116325]|uniref:hypothetical protein n=1 Tax=Streptomyces sp. 900116325 TaxID=3154295 RepID=UPI0033BE3991
MAIGSGLGAQVGIAAEVSYGTFLAPTFTSEALERLVVDSVAGGRAVGLLGSVSGSDGRVELLGHGGLAGGLVGFGVAAAGGEGDGEQAGRDGGGDELGAHGPPGRCVMRWTSWGTCGAGVCRPVTSA